MHSAWQESNISKAQEINLKLSSLHNVLFIESSPGPVKYAASLLGLCNEKTRLPLSEINDDTKKPTLSINLKYHSGSPVISNFERVSKPGRRIFSSADSLPKINNGLGIAIISTPKGVMTDIDARKQRVGGEIICKVF